MKRVMGDGVQIQLAVCPAQDKTIFCVHGLTANCRCWDVIAGVLSPYYHIVAMDLRGRGLSEAPSSGYSIDHHCRDIRAVMESLELEKGVFIGHSLGAVICLAFGAKYPEMVDRMIVVDGGGKLSEDQMAKVLKGIKPSLDRLGQMFPCFDDYLELMKKAPFLQPWSPALEAYFRYEVEEVDGGVRSRVRPEHIEEEILNLEKVDVSRFYAKILCPVLILRAPEGMLNNDDILLPQDALERMLREIPDARCVHVDGANHYSIIFQLSDVRDLAIREFLTD